MFKKRNMKISLNRQILSRIIIIFTAVSIIFGSIVFIFEKYRYTERLKSVEQIMDSIVKTKINTIGNMMFFRNRKGIEVSLKDVLNMDRIIGAEVHDKNGNLYYSSCDETKNKTIATHLNRDHYTISKTKYKNRRALAYTTSINVISEFHGFVTLYYDLEELIRHMIFSAVIITAVVLTLFLSIAVILNRLLKQLVTRPLALLAEVMNDVRNGELGKQTSKIIDNEIGFITEVFNKMSSDNSDMYEKLSNINKSLEKEVLIRTEELKKSQSLLESVLNSSHDSIMVLKSVTSDKGVISDFEWVMANPKASADFAVEVSSIIGKKMLSSLPSLKEEELFRDFVKAVKTNQPLKKEVYFDFEHIRGWFQITAVNINEGLAVTFHDITKIKMLQFDLEKQANKDGLTDIANRKYFTFYSENQWQICMEEKQLISLLFIDVDYFKKYNDTYGHLSGDDCLKRIAEVLKKNTLRPLDCSARYGGEEFVLFLPRTDIDGAVKIAEKINSDIKQLKIPNSGSKISEFITVSIGINTTIPDNAGGLKDFIEKADKALYKSKESGRNRYTVSE